MISSQFQKIKKSQGNILLAAFFLILVLITIFLFSRYHQVILFSNYEVNNNKLELNTLYQVKDELINCYSYPLLMTQNNCLSLKNYNYELKTIYNGLCKDEVILTHGVKTDNYKKLIIPVINTTSQITCIGELSVYFK